LAKGAIELNQILPLFLTVFFSIFHMLGGGAVGQGVRAAQRGSDKAMFFLLWGAGMGLVPLVFDWFFLIAQGHLIYGLVGPILFVVTALASAFLELKIDGGAVISAAAGSVGFLLGILSVPLMLDAAKTHDLGAADYVFGGCFVLLFVVIGGAFAWNGFSAIFRGIALDQEYAEREQEPGELGRNKRA
jgi:hypothetical protein